MAAQQANFRMEPGRDAMKQRMQAMMRYNRLRQETRASNAVLQVKRKHQRREAVDPRADEDSLERQQMRVQLVELQDELYRLRNGGAPTPSAGSGVFVSLNTTEPAWP